MSKEPISAMQITTSDMDQLHKLGFNLLRKRIRMTCDSIEQKDGAISILASFNLKPKSKFYVESTTWEVWAE